MAMARGFTNSGPLPTRLVWDRRRRAIHTGPIRNNYTARHDGAVPRRRVNPHHCIERVINHEPLAGRFDGNGLRVYKFGAAANEVVGRRRRAVRTGPIRNNYTARHDGAVPRRRVNPHHCIERVINHEPLAGRFDGNGLRVYKFGAAANEVVWVGGGPSDRAHQG